MRGPGVPSIDQLMVLLAVEEEGSFTAAAKRLGRATSAISYAIDTLEQQLGLSLFDRGTTRKPRLTREGEAVVSEAKAVAFSVETLRARVRGFLDNLEPEVRWWSIRLLPLDRLTRLLANSTTGSRRCRCGCSSRHSGGVERAVREGHAGIGVGSQLHMNMTGFRRVDIEAVRLIPVAAPGHPLARATGGIPREASDFHPAHPVGAPGRRRPRLRRRQPQQLADRRPGGEARTAARRARMGRDAGAGGPRRHRGRAASEAEPAQLAGRRIQYAGGPQGRHAAGPGGAVADRECGDPDEPANRLVGSAGTASSGVIRS